MPTIHYLTPMDIVHVAQGIRWVLPPKCASNSVRRALGLPMRPIGLDDRRGYGLPTVGAVRHPHDRLTSALYSVLKSDELAFEELVEEHVLSYAARPEMMDPHVRPLHLWYDEVVGPWRRLNVADIDEGWRRLRLDYPNLPPSLPHLNRGQRRPPRWEELDYDWSTVDRLYRRDFTLLEC